MPPRSPTRLLLVAAVLPWLTAPLGVPAALAAELAGQVVAIADGETLTLLTPERRQAKVRLAEIDTPEAGQPYGSRARQQLSELVFSKEVRAEVTDIDRYGRPVARVYAGATDVSAELVRRGAAWVYVEHSTDPALPPLEAEARAARRGLWALPEAERVPPWEWRKAQRGPAAARQMPPSRRELSATPAAPRLASPAPSARAFACGDKRLCGQMADCAEARRHLRECGLSRLDSDGDGMPCEALWRR